MSKQHITIKSIPSWKQHKRAEEYAKEELKRYRDSKDTCPAEDYFNDYAAEKELAEEVWDLIS